MRILVILELAGLLALVLALLHILPWQPTYSIFSALMFPDFLAVVWLKQRERRKEWKRS